MSLDRPELARLQHWMQEVVVHPGTVEAAIAADEAEVHIPSEWLGNVVLPSHSMTSAERIGVYHGMYLMRMEEALETDYPVIRYHLGDHQLRPSGTRVRPTIPVDQLHPQPTRRQPATVLPR